MENRSETDEHLLDLTLDDFAPAKRQVKVGNAYHDVLDVNSLGLVEITEIQHLEKRFAASLRKYEATPNDRKIGKETDRLYTLLIHMAVPTLSEAELASLGFVQKSRLWAFFNNRLADLNEAMAMVSRKARSTTPTSSPDSPSGTDSATESL